MKRTTHPRSAASVTALVALATFSLAPLAGCSTSPDAAAAPVAASTSDDTAAWQRDVAATGTTVTDWPKWVKAARYICTQGDVSIFLSGLPSTTSVEAIRANYRHACPEREPVLDASLAVLAAQSSAPAAPAAG